MNEYILGKNPCKRCRSKGQDKSGNNFTYYGEGQGGYCFSCGYTELSDEQRAERGIDKQPEQDDEVTTKEYITPEEVVKVKGYTGISGKNARGISDDTYKHYGVRTKYDESTGEPHTQYYPYFEDEKISGFKLRVMPKEWTTIGKISSKSELFGLFRYRNSGSKTICLTAGEIDCMSLRDALVGYNKSKGNDYEETPVVSMVSGEASSNKQLKAHYKYFDTFSKIIYFPDNDAAGQAAIQGIVKALPSGKVFIAKFNGKDINELTAKGREKEIVSAFFNAKAYTPSGIVASGTIYEEIVERSKQPKLPFPPMLKKLNKMLAGGMNYGYIVNILAGSGAGKSSLINQCVAYWMLDHSQPVLVASLEAEAAEFGENLLSYQMGKKISMIQNQQDKIDFVGSKEAEDTARNLFNREDGTPRLYLLDDRGDYSKLQEKIEEVIISCDVRIVVIDVISDVFSGMSIEQIDMWMSWEKKLVKQYNCILIQVAHTRKGGSAEKSASQGKALTEESIIGSGTQYRSAGINIALQRDKTSDDEILRNTTVVHLLKSRATGMTGVACELFYDNETHSLHDKEDWMAAHPAEF